MIVKGDICSEHCKSLRSEFTISIPVEHEHEFNVNVLFDCAVQKSFKLIVFKYLDTRFLNKVVLLCFPPSPFGANYGAHMNELTHFINLEVPSILSICTRFFNAVCSFFAVIQNFTPASSEKLRWSLSLAGQTCHISQQELTSEKDALAHISKQA